MIQPELWMLTPFVLFVSLKIPLINAAAAADDKSQRKPSSDRTEDYIITHYGREYYTPVSDIESSAAQRGHSGYYTAEVIPVDVHTGEELKPEKNLFVPMRTGYSIGVTDGGLVADRDFSALIKGNEFAPPPSPAFSASASSTARSEFQNNEYFGAKDDTKSKIPKKFFKSKYATASKKSVPSHEMHSASSSAAAAAAASILVEDVDPHQQRSKKNQKRNAFPYPDDDEFLRMFYDSFKTLMQQNYRGY